jgi:hypothetical protein
MLFHSADAAENRGVRLAPTDDKTQRLTLSKSGPLCKRQLLAFIHFSLCGILSRAVSNVRGRFAKEKTKAVET